MSIAIDIAGRPVPPGHSLLRSVRSAAGNAFPFLVVGALWEIVAHLGVFPVRLFPPLETIASAFVQLTVSGVLPHHAIETLFRLLAGFAIAATLGVAVGIAMGRSRRAQDMLLPLVSIGAPIPGLAYAPLFMLWFGVGNLSSVLLVGFVAAFPIILNTWTGVKAVKEIWVRSALALGADNRRLFRRVILPGALPYILTGLRLGLAQAWRILVARRDARLGAVGPRLAHLRLAQVPQHGRDAGRHRRHRRDRPHPREVRLPAPRGLHGHPLGHGQDMTANRETARAVARGAVTLLAVGGAVRSHGAQRRLSGGAPADPAGGRPHAVGHAR